MTAIMVGLISLALAVLLQRLMLERRARRLKACEQAFKFHAIRDELQLLALKKAVQQDNEVYDFILWTANLCIRNAGVIKLRDTLRVARIVHSKLNPEMTGRQRELLKAVKSAPPELQHLAGETFKALAEILVANDALVRAGLGVAVMAIQARKLIRPLFAALMNAGDPVARIVVPTHAEAVKYAREYHNWGGRLEAA